MANLTQIEWKRCENKRTATNFYLSLHLKCEKMSLLMAHLMETIPKLSDKWGLLLHSSLPVTATSPSHLITAMRMTRAFLFSRQQLSLFTSMHILHIVLCTFPMMLIRRICLSIGSLSSLRSFLLFSWPWCALQGWYCKKLASRHT